MSKLIEELEWKLDLLVEQKMKENYCSREENEHLVYEDFAYWLVNKFKESK
jgi:hypothetical protein